MIIKFFANDIGKSRSANNNNSKKPKIEAMQLTVLIIIIWVVLFFTLLPIGNIAPKKIQKGCADSAPEKHYLGYKLLLSLAVSIILALGFSWLFSHFPKLQLLFKY